MLTGSVTSFGEGAFFTVAAVAFQIELFAFTTAEPALGFCITCHCKTDTSLNSSSFGRTAAIVRNGRYVLDHADLETGGLQGTDGGFSAGAGAFDDAFNGFHTVFHGVFRGGFRSKLSGKGSALSGTFETGSTGGGPGDRVTGFVGDHDNRVIECGIDMGYAVFNIFLFFSSASLSSCHESVPLPLFLTFRGNGPFGTFAGTSVGFGFLTSDGETSSVANAAVAADFDQAFDVQRNISSEIAFD